MISQQCGRCTMSVIGVLLAQLVGCATYSRSADSYRHRKTKLQVALPDDWLRYNPARPVLTLTRDGLRLESISISMTKAGKKIPGTERVYQTQMLPHEIAELSLGLFEGRDDTKNFSIEKIELATVAGKDAYKADAIYIDAQGLPLRLRAYGVVIADYICEFRYVAARPIYFEKYLPVFERIVASASVGSK